MQRKIYNSSNKIIGYVEISENFINIFRDRKGLDLQITDSRIIAWSKLGGYNLEIIKCLYDQYFLSIGEIAALGNVLYHRANKWIKDANVRTTKSAKRRNPSFGTEFSQEHINAINSGRRALFDNGGKIPQYTRTPEIREKISQGVKKAQKEGRLPDPREVARRAWANDKFSHTNFKRGIGGSLYSKKNECRIFFRSLFELAYMIALEKDPHVCSYVYEPFHIPCEDGSSYTPDFLIGNRVIELKSKKFLSLQNDEYKKRFSYKVEQARKFCEQNNYQYEVIFDVDFNFDSQKFKHEIKDNDYVTLYQLKFFQPERVQSKK